MRNRENKRGRGKKERHYNTQVINRNSTLLWQICNLDNINVRGNSLLTRRFYVNRGYIDRGNINVQLF